jgi:hypothetical protein
MDSMADVFALYLEPQANQRGTVMEKDRSSLTACNSRRFIWVEVILVTNVIGGSYRTVVGR